MATTGSTGGASAGDAKNMDDLQKRQEEMFLKSANLTLKLQEGTLEEKAVMGEGRKTTVQ